MSAKEEWSAGSLPNDDIRCMGCRVGSMKLIKNRSGAFFSSFCWFRLNANWVGAALLDRNVAPSEENAVRELWRWPHAAACKKWFLSRLDFWIADKARETLCCLGFPRSLDEMSIILEQLSAKMRKGSSIRACVSVVRVARASLTRAFSCELSQVLLRATESTKISKNLFSFCLGCRALSKSCKPKTMSLSESCKSRAAIESKIESGRPVRSISSDGVMKEGSFCKNKRQEDEKEFQLMWAEAPRALHMLNCNNHWWALAASLGVMIDVFP